MKGACVETVRPADARGEVYGLVVAVTVVIIIWTGFLYHRSRGEEKTHLEAGQVSAFRDLNGTEQGVYADLRLAAEEIYQTYLDDKGAWPRLNMLRESGIAPFARDAAWKSRGKIDWRDRVETGTGTDRIAFLGERKGSGPTGSFLLEIHHHQRIDQDGPPYRVWYHTGEATWPAAGMWERLSHLGWKEVVAYEGQDERHRLKGSRL